MKRNYLAGLLVCTLLWAGCVGAAQSGAQKRGRAGDDSPAGRAFKTRTSDVQVEGEGVVTRLLADDLDGSRHQRFILRLASGQTILVAHNIDVAPRLRGLRKGDSVRFNGEYVWSEKGGTVHWTHHDPAGRHAPGWLKHKGRTYQ